MTRQERLKKAEEFLRELGRGISDEERVMAGYANEATVQTDASGKKMNAGWWPTPYKEGKYINQNANCYACISSSIKTPNPKTGDMRYWRGEASFGHGLALMVDDIGTGKGSKGNLSLEYFYAILPPTVVVETSPGNLQLWYFLDAPEPQMRRFKAFLSLFVSNVLDKGGDATIKDISRYGRMPCGINNKRLRDGSLKYPDEHGDPFQVTIQSADYSKRYSLDTLARAFKFELVVPNAPTIRVDEYEHSYDAAWFRMAQRILARAKLGEGSGGDVVANMSGKLRIACPWGEEHSNGDPFGAYFRGPIPGADVEFVFGCGHDTCRKQHKRTWAAFVDKVVMEEIVSDLEEVNRKYGAK